MKKRHTIAASAALLSVGIFLYSGQTNLHASCLIRSRGCVSTIKVGNTTTIKSCEDGTDTTGDEVATGWTPKLELGSEPCGSSVNEAPCQLEGVGCPE